MTNMSLSLAVNVLPVTHVTDSSGVCAGSVWRILETDQGSDGYGLPIGVLARSAKDISIH